MNDLVGQNLGQYQVQQLIGQGGMARVYKGYQRSLDRYVAIKAIPTQQGNARDSEFARRFTTEARLVARLSHPNIVPVHDYGEENGWAFIVMEYIAGGTVRDRLAQAEAQRRRMDLAITLDLMAQAAAALECAHQHGIIHRDVKPANMLLRTEEHLLLSDFGIAAMLEANRAWVQGGGNVGTPQYMAPEQGMPNGVVDARTDIYALGVVLFQCVTGRLPFDAESPMGIVAKHASERVPQPSALAPGLPPRVEMIILRALEKHPAQRFQRAHDMAEQLKEAAIEVRVMARSQPTQRQALVNGGTAVVPLPPRGKPGQPGTCFRCGAANPPTATQCAACHYDLTGKRALVDTYVLRNGHPLRCRITVRNGPMAGHWFVLHQDATMIGRTLENDVVIPDGTVSRQHARLVFANGHWVIEDLRSRNGTFVNKQQVLKEPVVLQHGDEVRLGDDFLTFELLG